MNEKSKRIFIEQRLKEIEVEIEEQEKLLKNKEDNWDYSSDFSTENYQKFLKHTEPERRKLGKLNREMRMIMPYELSELPDFGDVMSLDHFIECVNDGGFIDYDGYGHYVKDGKETNIEIYPSDVKYASIRLEFDTIIWYNR
ncbi:MAG: hypothetical protein WC333_00210 [Dehalococcoidia bacterium]|jgi:hypothetical protein